MGAGKSSLVLRFVKGQFFDFQAGGTARGPARHAQHARSHLATRQESTIGAAFLTQTVTVNDTTVKFEIWCAQRAAAACACPACSHT